jgi:hypothetical protein
VNRAEATAAAIGGTVVPARFEAALLVSAWAHETGRSLSQQQTDLLVELAVSRKVSLVAARKLGKASALRDAEEFAHWLAQQKAV